MNADPVVLIVGAGPTGLMMAAQLARFGVSCRIIDKSSDHTTQSRALVVQARSLEIFRQMGIAQAALAQGEIARAVSAFVRGKRVFRLNLEDVGTGLTAFPYLLMLEQSRTEGLLVEELARFGLTVERNTELLSFTQGDAGVRATVRHADGWEQEIRARWLVGADGGHSRVRTLLSIPFSGQTYAQSLFVLDCEADLPLPRNEMAVVFSDEAFTGYFPLTNGRMRVLGTVPSDLEGRDDITFDEIERGFAERTQMNVRLSNPEWISIYRSHHRAVSTFRAGRCFLANDAAHIHSPVGAQGMNTGLQDAYNLAWKVALVATGKARESLLDTYHEERSAIAHRLVRTTDRAFYYVNSPNRLIKGARLNLMPIAMRLVVPVVERVRWIRQAGFRTISQVALHYRDSRLSQEASGSRFPRSAPRAGDRLPYTGDAFNLQDEVDGTGFCLFLFPSAHQEAARQFGEHVQHAFDAVRVRPVPRSAVTEAVVRRWGLDGGGYLLVRPDLYVAYRARGFYSEPFQAYLHETVGLVSRTPAGGAV